ncbi:MAG: PTS sugar transporter subunit IIA [Deltaproteobacteria bacterium]|jgi:PTS system nitrogen regulatory IIA component
MRVVDMMSKDLIVAELGARTRDEVLGELVTHIAKHVPQVDRDLAHRYLIERERIASTGVSPQIAIPHARLERLDQPVACFGRSREGVEFGALDKKPTFLFMTILAPEGVGSGLHLKALARMSRLFKDTALRDALLVADGPETMWTLLVDKDATLS